MEKWITVEMGDGARRNMPKSKWQKAQEESKWLIETALKAGWTQEKAEKEFSIRIVKEFESQKPEVIFNEQYKKYRARVAFTLIEIHNMNETEALAKVAEQEEECYRLWKKNNPSEDTATKITRTSVG